MQQGGPPHGNQAMGGGYMPPNQQQQSQQGMGQPMNYYQQQPSGQYNQMGMQMCYQGPPSVPGSGNIGQPSSMSSQHNVGPPHGSSQPHQGIGQPQPSQPPGPQQQPQTAPQQPPPQHSGMMPQQPMYGQQNPIGDYGGRSQYMQQSYGNMPPQAAPQVPIGQHQGLPQQINPQNNAPPLSQPVHPQNIPQPHQPHHPPQHQPISQPIPSAQPHHQPQLSAPHAQGPSIYSSGLGNSSGSKPYTAPGSSIIPPAQAAILAARNNRRNLHMVVYSQEVLNNLQNYSVGSLCNIARELIHELNHKTVTISTLLKTVDKKSVYNPSQDIDQVVDYCLMLFDKLAEIRIRIDKKLTERPMKTEDFLKSFEDPSDPPDVRPEQLREKLDKFHENAKRIVDLSHDMKLLDWMGTVSDPSQLKKVDKMSCSSQNQPTN
ncbi:unnamed protein product [Auanema sp. JU1783]|nr:unnamed protein product [Auanema sp. JU1783]